MRILNFVILILFVASICSAEDEKYSVKEITEFSQNNLKGHVALYKDGWKIITSTQKSFEFAKKNSVLNAGRAWLMLASEFSQNSEKWKQEIQKLPKESLEIFDNLQKSGKLKRKKIFTSTLEVMDWEVDLSKKMFQKAVERFANATIHIDQFTQEDREAISKVATDFPAEVKDDFKFLKEVVRKIKGEKKIEIESSWKDSYNKAVSEWQKEYIESGQRKNSLSALPDVLWGNLKALWYGLFKQSGENAIYVGKKTFKLIEKGLVLPVAATLLVSGRIIWSLGEVTYYTTQSGIRVISETVEGGLLGAMALVSGASVPATYLTGHGIGFFNQVAFTAGGAGLGALNTVGKSVLETTNLTAKTIFHTGLESGKVIVGTALSGIVLGYNALTALPMQTLLGIMNGVGFLVWDGPRLAFYAASGKIGGDDIRNLPVGTVVDIKKLKESGIEVQEINIDESVLHKILENMPEDLKRNE